MSRTRLIASLTAIAACLAVVATLAVWTFPLKAAPQYSLPPIQDPNKAVVHVVPGLIISGITQGVPGVVVVGTTVGGVANGAINGVPGGVVGGVKNGVSGGINNGQSAPPQSSDQHYIVGGVSVDPIPGSPGHYLIHANPAVPAPAPQKDDSSARSVSPIATKRIAPVYPHEAIENHLEGAVNLTIIVNADGKVSDVEFINGTPEFAQAATDAAYQWEFQPPAKVPSIISARFHFTLSPTRRTPETPSIAAHKDPRAVGSLEVEVVSQDPSPQSAQHANPPAAKLQSSPNDNNAQRPATNTNQSPDPTKASRANPADSRFVGKFQFIPPAVTTSGKFQPIPPVTQSLPRGIIVGQSPPATTNQGVFVNVAPSNPATSPNPNSQNTNGPVYRAGQNGVTPPTCQYCPGPEYSPEMREAKLSGAVVLQVTVLANGRVGEIKVARSLEKSLDERAIKVVRDEWLFKPAIGPNGEPVNTLINVEISFQVIAPPAANIQKGAPPMPPPPAPANVPHPGAAPAPPLPTLANAPLTPNDGVETKIFTGRVVDDGASTPFYMGRVKTQALYVPAPEFPELARNAGIHQAVVTLNVIVDTEGKVISASYVNGPAMFAQAAIDAVRKWKITGTHDGVPVTFQISVEVSFSAK